MSGVLTRNGDGDGGAGDPPVAVLDIGSNSIRLVVYENAGRAPLPVFNEKVLAGLARGLDASGRLSEESMELALASIRRFSALAGAMGVVRIHAFATSAVRDAKNGAEFVAAIESESGIKVEVIDGTEEARLSALGVLSAVPDAKGAMGDLGGGSVELVRLKNGKALDGCTLPIGPLRLIDQTGGDIKKARRLIKKQISSVDWLPSIKGQTFHAVGGAWRLFARLHMEQEIYQPHIIHHYRMPVAEAFEFLRLIGGLSVETLQKIPGISQQRLELVPYAAYILRRVLKDARATELCFSAFGVREGCLYDKLPKTAQKKDPLIEGAKAVAKRMGRLVADGEALANWIAPVFAKSDKRITRLCRAASLLADLGWSEHPDYRAEMVFQRILRMPLVGLDHAERTFLALAVSSRHSAQGETLMQRYVTLELDPADIVAAHAIGLALRVFYTISGGAVSAMRHSVIERNGDNIRLLVPEHADILVGDVVARRLRVLANVLGCTSEVVFYTPEEAVRLVSG
jgi:exopolyphosphatase/guanosine-5'-triphosphate,3'-diphosphate pyrophosphatase